MTCFGEAATDRDQRRHLVHGGGVRSLGDATGDLAASLLVVGFECQGIAPTGNGVIGIQRGAGASDPSLRILWIEFRGPAA